RVEIGTPIKIFRELRLGFSGMDSEDKHYPKKKTKNERTTSMKNQNHIFGLPLWHIKLPLKLLAAHLRSANSILSRSVVFPLLLLSAGLAFVQPCAGAPFLFEDTGSLGTARSAHTATLLSNGKVLVAAGFGGGLFLANSEVYDPGSGTWSATGSLGAARHSHTATLLPNGKVLVAAGVGSSGSVAGAEVYEPAGGTWTATGSLGTARSHHTATLLSTARVPVAAGLINSSGFVASAELYEPASGTWAATGSLGAGRYSHTATLLPNGKVLVAGGFGS